MNGTGIPFKNFKTFFPSTHILAKSTNNFDNIEHIINLGYFRNQFNLDPSSNSFFAELDQLLYFQFCETFILQK